MDAITADEFAAMEDTAESTFFDECYILRRSTTTDEYGEEQETWTANSEPIICGFKPARQPETVHDALEATEIDGTLRLPADTDIDQYDRIRITERLGQAVANTEYNVVSDARRGPSAVVVGLRRVET